MTADPGSAGEDVRELPGDLVAKVHGRRDRNQHEVARP